MASIREAYGNNTRRKEEITLYDGGFFFFSACFDSCHSFITFTILFRHLHIMVVIIKVEFGGHSLHMIS